MNMLIEGIRIALIGLTSNRLRAFLTMIGITIGVAAVIVLISLGQGVQAYITNEVTSLGSNLITVQATRDEEGRVDDLTTRTAAALEGNVTGVNIVMPQYNANASVVYEGSEHSFQIQGVTTDYPALRSRSVVSGRFFTEEEQETQARVAVIGQEAAEQLFDTTDAVGKSIRIGAARFQIIGVLNAASSGGGPGASADEIILAPITTALKRLGGERDIYGDYAVSAIVMQASNTDTIDSTMTQIQTVLRQQRALEADEEDNFNIMSQQSLLETLTATIGMLTIFLGVIAGISLLVGGIGVMNIMLVTVTERTREIGLRKAVGAQSGDIVFQFLIEAVVMALFGGAVGIALAYGITALITALAADLPLEVQASSIALATAISTAVGIFFGIYPARRAAGLNPIDALRYE